MSRKDVTDDMVVQAARDYRAARPGPTPFVNELLVQRTGQSLKVCDAAIERALKRGVVECGVSARTCWPATQT